MSSARDGEDLGELLERLQTLLLSTEDLQEVLHGLAALASSVVEPPAACGITTLYDGRPATTAASDERAGLVDEQQYTTGTGPCLDALATGEIVEVPDQVNDTRWPGYASRATALGVRSSLSLPLKVEGRTVGALNVYGYDRPRTFGDDELRRLRFLADQGSTAIALGMRDQAGAARSRQLELALVSRSVIDQAIGVLMAQERCSSEAAFDLLRQHSQNTNKKLREVASDVVVRVTGHPPATGRPFLGSRGDS